MWEDPIVKEVRAAGAKLLKACGGDMRKLAQRLRANEAKHGKRVVTRKRVLEDAGRRRR